MRPARCSPYREFGESENRSAGAPIGGGTDSSQATGAPRYPNDPRRLRITRAGAASRKAIAGGPVFRASGRGGAARMSRRPQPPRRGWRGAALKGCATGLRYAVARRRRDIRAATRCGQRAARRTARSARSKTGPQAHPSAEAPIRPRRPEHLVIQTILARPSDDPSRSRRREPIAGGSVFRASGRGGAARMSRRRRSRREEDGGEAALKGCATGLR